MSDEIEEVTAFKWLDSFHPTEEAAKFYRAKSELIEIASRDINCGLVRANSDEIAKFIRQNAAEIQKILERLLEKA